MRFVRKRDRIREQVPRKPEGIPEIGEDPRSRLILLESAAVIPFGVVPVFPKHPGLELMVGFADSRLRVEGVERRPFTCIDELDVRELYHLSWRGLNALPN